MHYIDEFCTFLYYCKSLQFEDKPDYNYLKKLMRSTYNRYYFNEQRIYDWDVKPVEQDSEALHRNIADERKPVNLRVPIATFIENEAHYNKYKNHIANIKAKSDNKSVISESTTPRSHVSKVATLNINGKRNIISYLSFLKS